MSSATKLIIPSDVISSPLTGWGFAFVLIINGELHDYRLFGAHWRVRVVRGHVLQVSRAMTKLRIMLALYTVLYNLTR